MKSEQKRVAVIMAGGSGERFWPLSRTHRPKQLLSLSNTGETLLQQAVSRVLPIFPPDQVVIATSVGLRDVIRSGDARVPNSNVFAEPARRNTTGALVWAAANLMARHGDPRLITMAILTADHLIQPAEGFRRSIAAAMQLAEDERTLVTLGLPPLRPDTAYGYIEIEEEARPIVNAPDLRWYKVHRFREKPNQELAEEFVASDRFFWNSGMFFWTVETFLRELESAQPAIAKATHAIAAALARGDEATAVATFESLESISIDYALMERAQQVAVLRATFDWDDVGSWDALSRTHDADSHGNVALGDVVLVDARDSIVWNAGTPGVQSVAVVGLTNVVVVVTEDGVLVASKEHVQDVRKAVSELKKRGSSHI